jgi:hypothetical protein
MIAVETLAVLGCQRHERIAVNFDCVPGERTWRANASGAERPTSTPDSGEVGARWPALDDGKEEPPKRRKRRPVQGKPSTGHNGDRRQQIASTRRRVDERSTLQLLSAADVEERTVNHPPARILDTAPAPVRHWRTIYVGCAEEEMDIMSDTMEQRIDKLEGLLSAARAEASAWRRLAEARGEIIYCVRFGNTLPTGAVIETDKAVLDLRLCGAEIRYRPEVDMPWPLVPLRTEPHRG